MFGRCRRFLAPATVEDVAAAFKVLGLAYNPRIPSAPPPTLDDVRKQYRELARLHHPDLSSGDDNRMKVINTAYELIQSSGALHGTLATGSTANTATTAKGGVSGMRGRFSKKAGSRRRRVPDDFANGDDTSWTMKSSLDWESMMNSTDTLTEAELKNPANHPFSHSKFFTFEEDVTIYRMIRGGATVAQVGRTLGKPATFVERRLQNAQFKMRIQYVLRSAKREKAGGASTAQSSGSSLRQDTSSGPTASQASAKNTTRRSLRRSPFEDGEPGLGAHPSAHSRKKEWEPTHQSWQPPKYFDDMSLEEKGLRNRLIKPHDTQHEGKEWVRGKRPTASKLGRSYANYSRLSGNPRSSSQ